MVSPVVAVEVGGPALGSCLRCPEGLSQGVGGLEKEEQVPGVRTSLLNTPSAERGW